MPASNSRVDRAVRSHEKPAARPRPPSASSRASAGSVSTRSKASRIASVSSGSTSSAFPPAISGRLEPVGRDHRRAGHHGFQHREAEPLIERRVGEAAGTGVERGEVVFGDSPKHRGAGTPRGGHDRVVIPAARSHQRELV